MVTALAPPVIVVVAVVGVVAALYLVMRLSVVFGKYVEKLNPLATGDVGVLQDFLASRGAGAVPRVLVVVASYGEDCAPETVRAWLAQDYPDYLVVVAEDGGVDYGVPAARVGYRYSVGGRVVAGVVEKHVVDGRVFLVVRRRGRLGRKAGALNNVVYLAAAGLLGALAGRPGWRPDYLLIVDADHVPGGNPLAHQLGARGLAELEEAGRRVLGYPGYRLDPAKMSDPATFITRMVELAEYHRIFAPGLAVVQAQQSHRRLPGDKLSELVAKSYERAQWALVLRSPRIIVGGRGELVFLGGLLAKIYYLLFDWLLLKPAAALRGARGARVSRHLFPIFTGSSAIIRFDVAVEYWFADGVFVPHASITEDYEFSSRIQADGYLVFATRQAETIGLPPRGYAAFLRQQYRWALGTLIDYAWNRRRVFSSPVLEWTGKYGYVLVLLYYLGPIIGLGLLALAASAAAAFLGAPAGLLAAALIVAGYLASPGGRWDLTRTAAYLLALISYLTGRRLLGASVTAKAGAYSAQNTRRAPWRIPAA